MSQRQQVIQKNGTMHSKFKLKNLIKISEFNRRTNNYFEKEEDGKQTKPVK